MSAIETAGGISPWVTAAVAIIVAIIGATGRDLLDRHRRRRQLDAQTAEHSASAIKTTQSIYDELTSDVEAFFTTERQKLEAERSEMRDIIRAAEAKAAQAAAAQATAQAEMAKAQAELATVLSQAGRERHELRNELSQAQFENLRLIKEVEELREQIETLRARIDQRLSGRRNYDPPQLNKPDED